VDEEIAFDRKYLGLMIPELFTQLPPVRDALVTGTSKLQDETVEVCLPCLGGDDEFAETNEHGVPRLDREKHVRFLHQCLGRLPGRFVAADASRPWFLYWCLSALAMLGEDVTAFREALTETARSMQNASGGFGGGGGQLSHMATTYAIVLSLALVGGEDAYEVVDRKAMWRWLCSLKQPDGGFQVCLGGEEDIRYVWWCLGEWEDSELTAEKGGVLRGGYHLHAASPAQSDSGVPRIPGRRQRRPPDGCSRLRATM
jgi:protein farnesyltransferase subunit beta